MLERSAYSIRHGKRKFHSRTKKASQPLSSIQLLSSYDNSRSKNTFNYYVVPSNSPLVMSSARTVTPAKAKAKRIKGPPPLRESDMPNVAKIVESFKKDMESHLQQRREQLRRALIENKRKHPGFYIPQGFYWNKLFATASRVSRP